MATWNAASTNKFAGIMSKPGKTELAEIVPPLLAWFREHQYQVVVDPETAPYAPGVEVLSRDDMGSRPLNFVVVLGGDGTLIVRRPGRYPGPAFRYSASIWVRSDS